MNETQKQQPDHLSDSQTNQLISMAGIFANTMTQTFTVFAAVTFGVLGFTATESAKNPTVVGVILLALICFYAVSFSRFNHACIKLKMVMNELEQNAAHWAFANPNTVTIFEFKRTSDLRYGYLLASFMSLVAYVWLTYDGLMGLF